MIIMGIVSTFYYSLNIVTRFSPYPRHHSTTSPTLLLSGKSKQQLTGAVLVSVPVTLCGRHAGRLVAMSSKLAMCDNYCSHQTQRNKKYTQNSLQKGALGRKERVQGVWRI